MPPRPPAGLGRLSWQREEACFAGPGLPWGQPLLGLQGSVQPLAQPASAWSRRYQSLALTLTWPRLAFPALKSRDIVSLLAISRGLALLDRGLAVAKAEGAAWSSDHRN